MHAFLFFILVMLSAVSCSDDAASIGRVRDAMHRALAEQCAAEGKAMAFDQTQQQYICVEFVTPR